MAQHIQNFETKNVNTYKLYSYVNAFNRCMLVWTHLDVNSSRFMAILFDGG